MCIRDRHYSLTGEVGFPFFGEMILDCINRTENAMTQEHIFKAQELCLKAQEQALNITCLLYTSDAADERSSVDLGGRRIIKKKKNKNISELEIYINKSQHTDTRSL